MRALRFEVRWALILLAALGVPAAAGAQFAGTWDITAQFALESEEICDFTGTGELDQVGGSVTGPIQLGLDPDEPTSCPPQMSGALMATVRGSTFAGTVDGANNPGGNLGTVEVTGTVSVPPGPVTAASAPSTSMSGMTGSFTGPFAGSSGTFMGTLAPTTVPSIGPLILVAMALVVLGGGTLLLVRRRAAA